jgi:hypothetical protein
MNRKTSAAQQVDPPSSVQHDEESARLNAKQTSTRQLSGKFRPGLLVGLKPGSWAAVSSDREHVVGTGMTREQAERSAHDRGYVEIMIAQVPGESRAEH